VPILGIDIGTQSLKAAVLSEEMAVLGAGSVAYAPSFPRPGWAEQDPGLWLAALRPAIGLALAAARLSTADIRGLAVCGQLDGCVPCNADREAVGAAIIWMDRRGEAALRDIDARLIAERCGLVCDATHMGAKILWLSKQSGLARMWHQPVSFVVEQLTGAAVMSHSLASTTMLYDVRARDWSDELLALFGATRGQMPVIAGETEIAGSLTAEGAALAGLPEGVPVAVGTGDDFSNLLGCGICAPGIVGVSLGTAEAVGALSEREVFDPELLVETHAFPGGRYHLGNPGWLGGGSVRWAAGVLGMSEESFTTAAAAAPAGCEGLVFIPALSGAMAPKWIAGARGSFVGLSLRHRGAHMARAVLEGTAFALRDVVERLAALGVPTDQLRLMGGGARSALWCQIKADVTGRPAEAVADGDASAVGAALLAAVAVGIASDIRTACATLAIDVHRFTPQAQVKPAYDWAYAQYRATFAALEPYWEGPHEIVRPVREDS
jgi:xylulokinase